MACSRELSLQSVTTQYQQQQASLQQDHRMELAELEVQFCPRFFTIVLS
jgi:hypothetical protein